MEWIKVSDRLPKDMAVVLVKMIHDSGSRSVNVLAWYSKLRERWERVSNPEKWRCIGNAWDLTTLFESVDGTVTHWMPLPKAADD